MLSDHTASRAWRGGTWGWGPNPKPQRGLRAVAQPHPHRWMHGKARGALSTRHADPQPRAALLTNGAQPGLHPPPAALLLFQPLLFLCSPTKL